jgi:hypothetical protein
MGKRGRPPVLTDEKRAQIVALLKLGCSQNMAAEYVGCSSSTIQNTAERDPEFAEKLRRARGSAEIGWLESIRKAAKKEQYWRAAAWALERAFPERYARRGPDVLTVEQVGLLMSRFSQIVIDEIPERYRSRILKSLDTLSRGLGIEPKQKEKKIDESP